MTAAATKEIRDTLRLASIALYAVERGDVAQARHHARMATVVFETLPQRRVALPADLDAALVTVLTHVTAAADEDPS
jgi:hypothetical protein